MAQLSDLPTELLLEIFSNLDYVSLMLNVQRVCTHYRDIVRSSWNIKLIENIFHCDWNKPTQPPQPPLDETHTPSAYYFELHPCIQYLVAQCDVCITDYGSYVLEITEIGFRGPTVQDFIPLHTTSISDELAFSPGLPADIFWNEERVRNPPRYILKHNNNNNKKGLIVQWFADLLAMDYDWVEVRRRHHVPRPFALKAKAGSFWPVMKIVEKRQRYPHDEILGKQEYIKGLLKIFMEKERGWMPWLLIKNGDDDIVTAWG